MSSNNALNPPCHCEGGLTLLMYLRVSREYLMPVIPATQEVVIRKIAV
jgi:hypothetical protein